MAVHPKALIARAEEVDEMARELRGQEMIGIDTEFVRETTFFPKIGLIQIASADNTWLVDPVALDAGALEPLFEILRDPKILKIMHAAYADQECLFWAYKFIAEPVLDTAVAAALCGYGDNIGLGKLSREVLGVHLPKGRARVKWLARPLPKELLQYAEQDVAHLVALGRKLRTELQDQDRFDWALDESRMSASDFEVSPDELARRIARNGQIDITTFLVLRELITWRERRAQSANMPRAWVADNEILIALARVRPSTMQDLQSFRGLHAKELDRSGAHILEAIETGSRLSHEGVVLPPKTPSPAEHETHALELVKAYLAYLAAHHAVAPRYLLHSQRTWMLLQSADRPLEEWIREGILTEPASRLIGLDLKALLEGRRALVLRAGRVEILPV